MVDLRKIYLYRMTHIDNVPDILVHGITHKTSPHANSNFTPIGDPSLISTRNGVELDNGRTLGEYVPFYFGTRMPMLYVIQNGFNGLPRTAPEQIVYCVSSVEKVLETNLDFVFTDGHAVDSFTTQYTKKEVEQIGQVLDMGAIKAKYWNNETDLDLKRRKEAEFLVLGDMPVEAILGFIAYNEHAKTILTGFGISENKVHIDSKRYF